MTLLNNSDVTSTFNTVTYGGFHKTIFSYFKIDNT